MAAVFKVHELLETGKENPRTGRELANAQRCDIRHITLAIEAERREGFPICAATGGRDAGYYLAADAEELEAYRKRLSQRERELHKTGEALAMCQI